MLTGTGRNAGRGSESSCPLCGWVFHTAGLTVHNDGEQAVKERLQTLMPAGYDLVKDLRQGKGS